MADRALADITHTIQIAVAPVFLLSALGMMLSVLTTRLSRIIDRARLLERDESAGVDEELARLSRRARWVHRALTSSVIAALSVCLLISMVFLGYLTEVNLGAPVALLFIIAMALFVFSLVSFLREAVLSIDGLHFARNRPNSAAK